MTTTLPYDSNAPTREAVDAAEGTLSGAVMIEFGTGWCGHCRAAQVPLSEALSAHPGIRHLKIEDGKGRPLGRSYRVTLWPTLIFLHDGKELARLVRPTDAAPILDALALIDPPV
jgi:thioredoxin 1